MALPLCKLNDPSLSLHNGVPLGHYLYNNIWTLLNEYYSVSAHIV